MAEAMKDPTFVAKDAGYAQRVRASFARQGAMTLIGAEMTELAPGYCAISIRPKPEILQQHGYVHAGIVATIVDSAGGYAGFTLFPAESSVLTVEFKLNLLAPAKGERIVADPEERKRRIVVRKGRENYLCLLNLEDAMQGAFTGRAAGGKKYVETWPCRSAATIGCHFSIIRMIPCTSRCVEAMRSRFMSKR